MFEEYIYTAISILAAMIIGAEYNIWRIEHKLKKYWDKIDIEALTKELKEIRKAFVIPENPEISEEKEGLTI